jgi:hypothetical protein
VHTKEAISPPEAAPRIRQTHARVKARGTGETAAAFANESEYARTLASEHGKFWEFLLVQELLRARLSALKRECDALEKARMCVPTRQFNGAEFMDWLRNEMNVMAAAITKMTSCMKVDLPNALGKPGVSGDAIQILRTIDTLFAACGSILAFERDVCAADPPAKLSLLKDAFGGITLFFVRVLERFVQDWSRAVDDLREGLQNFDVKIVLPAPPQLAKVSAEIEKISKDPEKYR